MCCTAQQLDVSGGYYPHSSDYNAFDKHFLPAGYYTVQLKDTRIYHLQHVSKITITDPGTTVFWMAELDTQGNVLSKGINNGYYFITQQSLTGSRDSTTVVSYYLQQKLMRRDTVICTLFYDRHGDTTVSFRRTKTISCWNGALINERNAYYNEHYLHRHIMQGHVAGYKGKKEATHTYLHHPLPTDYDTGKIYADKIQIRDDDLVIRAGANYLLPEQLKLHPLVLQYGKRDKMHTYTKGAAFEEPHVYFEIEMCGTTMQQHANEARDTHYGFSTGTNGLYESYYSELQDRYYNNEEQNKRKPEREVLFRFQYEYFPR